MSDVAAATTQTGAAPAAPTDNVDAFQGFWNADAKRDEGAPDAQNVTQQGAPEVKQPDASQQIVDSQDGQQQVDDTPTYSSLTELLTAHKIDPESVMGLHVTTKIDGVEKNVPLSDVLKSYQLEGHVNNKSIEVSNLRAQVEQERQQFQQAAQQEIQRHQAMGNLAMQMLNQDFARIDWNTLRANNPAEFAALQAEFQNRQAQIGQYMQNVQGMAAQEAERQQAAMRQSLAGENERLMGARPQWRDPQVFTKDREQMTQYARSLGFKDAELSQIYDHRYMLILHDAAQYRALQAATPQALKQVRQAPVMGAPGSRQDVNPNEAQRRSVVERLNRNPRDQDAQAAAFEFFAK